MYCNPVSSHGKTSTKIFLQIKDVCGDGIMNRMNVFKWCCDLNEGRTNFHDNPRSGRYWYFETCAQDGS